MALFGFFTVERPRDCKPVREHAKTVSPERFLKRHANNPSFCQFRKQVFRIVLTRADSQRRLLERVGKQVVVLGSVSGIRGNERGPTTVKLGRSRGVMAGLYNRRQIPISNSYA